MHLPGASATEQDGVPAVTDEQDEQDRAADRDEPSVQKEALSASAGSSRLDPRGMQELEVINSVPGLEWSPKLLAVRLEGQDAEADEKDMAHGESGVLKQAKISLQVLLCANPP